MAIPAPPGVWDEYKAGTSLGSDIARLVGGGLYSIGGIQREQEKLAQERADRLAREKRLDQQFQESHDQAERHFQLSRADKFGAAADKEFVVGDSGDLEAAPDFQWDTVPAARVRGAALLAGKSKEKT